MAQAEQFLNWLTNQPMALLNAVNSVFGASGTNHSVGLVPDPGSSAGTTRALFEDGTWKAISTAVSGLTPNGVKSPGGTTYTVQSTDYLSVISSGGASGTLTITLPSPFTNGFMVGFFVNSHTIVLSPAGGAIIVYPSNTGTTSLTLFVQYQVVWLVCDGANYYVIGENFPVQPGPTYQSFTSGSGNYTPTTGAVVRIKVRICGGGGGGGASTTNAGTTGNTTTFGSWTAVGGGAGGAGIASGGAGGTGGANGTGTQIVRLPGGQGMSGFGASTSAAIPGSIGGVNPFGGAGANGGANQNGANGATNTGAGGQGGGCAASGTAGAGGGAGEYVEFFVSSPGVTAYTVGATVSGGAAGTHAGGNGAAGIILIEEFYF